MDKATGFSLNTFFNDENNEFYRYYAVLTIVLIFLSIAIFTIELRFREHLSDDMKWALRLTDVVIIFVFAAEYVLRIVCSRNRLRYAFGFYGIVDLLAVGPSIVAMIAGIPVSTGFLRVFRLTRLFRILKLVRLNRPSQPLWEGILARTAPFIVSALALKVVIFAIEDQDWMPKAGDFGTILAVVGFCIGVLLGSKLSVAQARLHKFEDSLLEAVGLLESIRMNVSMPTILEWVDTLDSYLKTGKGQDRFLESHRRLIVAMQEGNVGAPLRSSLHQKVAYIVFRMKTTTPAVYDEFLQRVTIIYSLAVIFIVPGTFGLISIVLIVYVLGGMYFVITDLSQPITHHARSLINANITPFTDFKERCHKYQDERP